jgi:hypothetical protein
MQGGEFTVNGDGLALVNQQAYMHLMGLIGVVKAVASIPGLSQIH